jgi:hypothetical protein
MWYVVLINVIMIKLILHQYYNLSAILSCNFYATLYKEHDYQHGFESVVGFVFIASFQVISEC